MSDSTAFPAGSASSLPGAATTGLSNASERQPMQAVANSSGKTRLWSRVAVLAVGLVSLKIVLLASQGKSLYEAHWRTSGTPGSWLNLFAFYLFILLGGLSLWSLGRIQQSAGVRGIRTTNGAILLLGLAFIFLTFHNGDKNYLYPVMNGLLDWTSLVPYMANSLFFNPPFLAAWIFVYAVLYYVFARTGRERWGLFLTACFACAYSLINLKDLMNRRDELLIIDCLGAVSVFAAWRVRAAKSGGSISLAASGLLAPLGWTLFFLWALLRFDDGWHGIPATYFVGLTAMTLVLFIVVSSLVRQVGNPVGWSWLVLFFFSGFLLLCDNYYPVSENYNHVLCLGLTFPRYFLGELAVVGGIAVSGWVYLRLRPNGNLWWLDIACLGALVLATIDLRLTQIMGARLSWDVLSFGDSPKMMLKLAKPYLPGVITSLIIGGAIYLMLVRAIQLLSERRQKVPVGSSGLLSAQVSTNAGRWYLAAVFVGLGLVGLGFAESDKVEGQAIGRLVLSSPLWKRVANRPLSRDEFLKTAQSLGLGDLGDSSPVALASSQPRELNVLVVFMESSYNKHLSLFGSTEETEPLLSKYQDRMELFPNFFSAFAGSIHARFATFTSLYPATDFHAFTQERVPVKSFFEVMHEHGYACSMFYSSYFDYTGFRDFLKNRGLDEMYDADTMPGQRGTERVEWGLLEEETLGAIRGQLQKYAQSHQRFCLTYVPAAPHYPYDRIPKQFQKHKMKEMRDYTPLYLNELLYMDWVLASIVDQLKESGLLDNTLVVITNDHGEMLGGKDDEHVGHGWAMTPELANTPLIIMDPANPGCHINKSIGTQVDFLPTILGRLNIPLPSNQLYEGHSLDATAEQRERLGYCNSYKQFGIVESDKIMLGDREANNPAGIASRGAVFTIGNDGARTVFTESKEPSVTSDRVAQMARFDAFQANLLRNYALYCQSIHAPPQQAAQRAAK